MIKGLSNIFSDRIISLASYYGEFNDIDDIYIIRMCMTSNVKNLHACSCANFDPFLLSSYT